MHRLPVLLFADNAPVSRTSASLKSALLSVAPGAFDELLIKQVEM